jgi:hypothetical protein
LLFQTYAGTPALDPYYEEIMNQVRRRMIAQPMKEHLKRHLLGVWLCALAYNPNLTMAYFEREKLTNEFFNQVT